MSTTMRDPATIGTITSLTRLRGSVYGNPRYLVGLDGIGYRTQPNAGWVYAITDAWIGRRVRINLDGRGNIVAIAFDAEVTT